MGPAAGEVLHPLGVVVDSEHLHVVALEPGRRADLPNRPRPITTTPPDWAIFLANEGRSFGQGVAAGVLTQGEGDRAEPAQEHEEDEHEPDPPHRSAG